MTKTFFSKMKKILFTIFLGISIITIAQETGIKFKPDNTFEAALKTAKEENKLIFIDCYTSWCGPCKKMEKEVFTKQNVGEFYNKNFINFKLDLEESFEGFKVRKKYKINSFPTLLFINSEGEIVKRGRGGRDANSFIDLGKKALKNTNILLPLRAKIKAGDRSAEVISKYLKIVPNSLDKDTLLNEYYKSKNDKERLSPDSWNLLKNYISDIDHPEFQFFLKNRSKFEEKYSKSDIKNVLFNAFEKYHHKNYRDPSKVATTLKEIDSDLYNGFEKKKEYEKAYYESRKNKDDKKKWQTFITKAKTYFSLNNNLSRDLNSASWYIYSNRKNIKDKKALKLAKKWSESSLEINPKSHYYNDTYAHLLFELGDIEGAIKYQTIAVELSSTKFYAKELARYKKVLADK